MRQNFWVMRNLVVGDKAFNCNETMTYTTHGDFTFLDNLEPLLERWQGPVSVALYSPGSDLNITVRAILYYRHCSNTTLVRDWASFHVFFDLEHIPDSVPDPQSLKLARPDCERVEFLGKNVTRYKTDHGLDYPVNIAR